jgi:hypothetical protein
MWGWTGRSSGPVSVNVELHQQWEEWLAASSGFCAASCASAGMYMDLVRRCLQRLCVLISQLCFELQQGAANESFGNLNFVTVL